MILCSSPFLTVIHKVTNIASTKSGDLWCDRKLIVVTFFVWPAFVAFIWMFLLSLIPVPVYSPLSETRGEVTGIITAEPYSVKLRVNKLFPTIMSCSQQNGPWEILFWENCIFLLPEHLSSENIEL